MPRKGRSREFREIHSGDLKRAFWDDFPWQMRLARLDMLGMGDYIDFSWTIAGSFRFPAMPMQQSPVSIAILKALREWPRNDQEMTAEFVMITPWHETNTYRDRKKGVITKGVFSPEKSLESLKSLNSLESLENGRILLYFPESGGSLESLESLNYLESLENGLFWKDPFSKRPLFPNPNINNLPDFFLYSRGYEYKRGMCSHRNEFPQEFGKILRKQVIKNLLLYSHQSTAGPACIRAKINSFGCFSCVYWFCAGGYLILSKRALTNMI